MMNFSNMHRMITIYLKMMALNNLVITPSSSYDLCIGEHLNNLKSISSSILYVGGHWCDIDHTRIHPSMRASG